MEISIEDKSVYEKWKKEYPIEYYREYSGDNHAGGGLNEVKHGRKDN